MVVELRSETNWAAVGDLWLLPPLMSKPNQSLLLLFLSHLFFHTCWMNSDPYFWSSVWRFRWADSFSDHSLILLNSISSEHIYKNQCLSQLIDVVIFLIVYFTFTLNSLIVMPLSVIQLDFNVPNDKVTTTSKVIKHLYNLVIYINWQNTCILCICKLIWK